MAEPLQSAARLRYDPQSMPSIVWKGHLTFGLVSIPVKLFRAARRERVRLHYVHRPEIEEPLSGAAMDRAGWTPLASEQRARNVETVPPAMEPAPAPAPVSRVRQ